MDRVASHNWNLLIGQGESFQQVARQVDYFRTAVTEAGLGYHPDRITVARAMYTAPTLEQAHKDAQAPFMWFKRTGQEVSAPPGSRAELLPENYREYRRRFSADATFDYETMAENVILFGPPDLVGERIETLRQSGVENLIFFVNYGGIENRKVLDSLELFATRVAPQFKD